MATKFSNQQERYFKKLYEGLTREEIISDIKDDLEQRIQPAYMNKFDYYLSKDIEEFEEVEEYFQRMKPLDEIEMYAINAWGYEQTNLENFTVVGQVGASMVCIGAHCIWSVSKAKYNKKEPYTSLDSDHVRSTSWETWYPFDEIAENRMHNAYFGH